MDPLILLIGACVVVFFAALVRQSKDRDYKGD
jgi:hypothetical protein